MVFNVAPPFMVFNVAPPFMVFNVAPPFMVVNVAPPFMVSNAAQRFTECSGFVNCGVRELRSTYRDNVQSTSSMNLLGPHA